MSKISTKQRDALERIKNNPEIAPFFFKEAKGLFWFDAFLERGYFEPSKIPKPKPAEEEGFYQIPSWPIVEYLVNNSSELNNLENREYANKFLEVIRSTSHYAIEKSVQNYRIWWQFAKIMNNLPVELIKLSDVPLLSYWLKDSFNTSLVAKEVGESLFVKIVKHDSEHTKDIGLKLLESLTEIRWREKTTLTGKEKEPFFYIDSYYAEKIFEKIAPLVGNRLGVQGIEILYRRFKKEIEKEGRDTYSYIWRPAIEEHKQNSSRDDTINILISAYRDSLISLTEKNHEPAKEIIKDLLNEKLILPKRIAIHVISHSFEKFSDSVSLFLKDDFFCNDFRHELFHFLKENFLKLDAELQKRIINIISSFRIENKHDQETEEKYLAYRKLIWLSAIKDLSHDAEKLYDANLAVTGAVPENPDFSSYTKSGSRGEISPYKKEELLEIKDINKLVKVLNEFKEESGWEKPSLRGLADQFKLAVKAEPDRFIEKLGKFIDGDLAFSYEIIEAYRELWEGGHPIKWGAVFDFCKNLIERKDFGGEELSKERESFVANRYWIVGSIARLIESGTKSDDKAFDPKYLPDSFSILQHLLNKEKGEDFKVDSDAVRIAINNPRGKCIEALINYALRSSRLSDKEHSQHDAVWKGLKPIFENELNSANRSNNYEFATLIANYLFNFLYLSRKWTLDNLDKIFSIDNNLQWLCAIKGFSYVGHFDKDVYFFLKEKGHFIKVLDSSELEDSVKEKIIGHIVISYINDTESLECETNSIKVLLDRNIYEELRHLIWFIWTLRKNDDKKLEQKVMALWPLINNKINNNTKEGKLLYADLSQWSVFVDFIDEKSKVLLTNVAPFAGEDHNSYVLVESLARLSSVQPMEAGDVFLKMLEGCAPTYEEEKIKETLSNIWNKGHEGKLLFDQIHGKYLTHGVDFLSKFRAQLKEKAP